MPRLRTTTALSLLALVVGVAATGWLSARSGIWLAGSPAALAALVRPGAATPAPARRRHADHHAASVIARRALPVEARTQRDETAAATPAPAPALVPISTPAADTPYDQLRGHLDGSVLLAVTVDGDGRVRRARLARSSGDPVLDAHALEVVQGWRFAVPADRPDGLSGELPMRFDSGTRLARTP